jgi:cyanophycinase-like exopeptidase
MGSLVDSLDLHLFINSKFTHSTIVKVFERLGAEEVRIVDTQTRDDAFSSTVSLTGV